jgi:hypothetical protein
MGNSSDLAAVGAAEEIVGGGDGRHYLLQVLLVEVHGRDVAVGVEDAVILRQGAEQGVNILLKDLWWLVDR